MELMLVNNKYDIFIRMSTSIFPKVLTLWYPVHIKTLAVI